MRKTRRRPDVYIRSLREDVRDDMTALDALLSKEMKGLPRVMWEDAMWGGTQQAIIGYGDYRSQRSDKIEVNWFVVGLTAQKKYLSVYVNAVEDGRYLAETFASELGTKTGKSSITFKRLNDVRVPVLAKVVRTARKLMA